MIKGYTNGVNNAPFKVIGGVIVCSLRSMGVAHSLEMIELANKYYIDKHFKESVVGWDIAGHEGLFPLQPHEEALKKGKSLSLPLTIHAGEWGLNDQYNTIENLRIASLYSDRVGHALTLPQDKSLLKQFAESNLTIEVNLTSNVKRMNNDYTQHPIKQFIKHLIPVSLNCDN